MPADFDTHYLGLSTLERVLALSRNIASIRLVERLGPPVVVSFAHRAGIMSHLDPVLSLGLGVTVVSPLEMASSFGTFANGGIYEAPFSIMRIEDNTGKVLESHPPEERETMTPQLAYLVTSLLKGVVNDGTGMYARRLKRPVAGKTGTTNDNRDLWFIGYTPDLVAAAWMGYDDFTSLGPKDRTGGQTVLPWWTEIMDHVTADMPKRDFVIPPKIVLRNIDNTTGFLALPSCPRQHIVLQAFLSGTEPKAYCPVDHSKPVQPQLEALTSSGTISAVTVSTSATPIIVAPVSLSTSPDNTLPGEESEEGEAPVFLH
jgi:penicillin-binding protein 1A